MSCRIVNLESGHPTLEEARRRLIREIESARKQGVRVLKIIHGYGSSGPGGVLAVGIRKSLRIRVKEGVARAVIPGESFSSDANATREFLVRHPTLRRDNDLNRANLGMTLVELTVLARGGKVANP